MEVIEEIAIEGFSFFGEITFPMLRSEFALANATLVMTENKVTASILLANAFEAVSSKVCL